MKTGQQEYDKVVNSNWDILIGMFNEIIKTNPTDKKERCEKLKELARAKQLTPRQMEGIIDRCNNVINGSFRV